MKAILILIAAIVAIPALLISSVFIPRPWEKTEVTIYTQTCGDFSVVLKEKRTINRLEGSSVAYLLDYVDSDMQKTIETLGGNTLAGFDPTPVHTKIPVYLFEDPQGSQAGDRTVYINPGEFSRDEYDAISSCLKSNQNSFSAALISHLQDVKRTDGGMNIHRNGNSLRIIGTAYADRQDFYTFMNSNMEWEDFEDESLGRITIGVNGLVAGQYERYLGNYFELIPENSTSSLKDFDIINDQGVYLLEYLRRLALKGAEYTP